MKTATETMGDLIAILRETDRTMTRMILDQDTRSLEEESLYALLGRCPEIRAGILAAEKRVSDLLSLLEIRDLKPELPFEPEKATPLLEEGEIIAVTDS